MLHSYLPVHQELCTFDDYSTSARDSGCRLRIWISTHESKQKLSYFKIGQLRCHPADGMLADNVHRLYSACCYRYDCGLRNHLLQSPIDQCIPRYTFRYFPEQSCESVGGVCENAVHEKCSCWPTGQRISQN